MMAFLFIFLPTMLSRHPIGSAWLYAGDQATLHIMAGKLMPANAAGVIDVSTPFWTQS